MTQGLSRRELCQTGIALVLAAQSPAALARAAVRDMVPGKPRLSAGTSDGEWRTYGGDLSSTRYSALDQITADNFSDLQLAWRFRPDNLGPVPDPNLQATPLMDDGVLYLTAGSRRAAVALDAKTGEMLWKYNLDEGARGKKSVRPGSGRGLSLWSDGTEKRILYVTPGYRLVALDAATGQPIQSFGEDGMVDLKTQLDQDDIDLEGADIGLHASPLVVGDVIVVGAAHLPSSSPQKKHIKGAIRGYDVRSGKRLWIFHTIPQKGEFGNDTWLNGSEVYTGNAGSWAQMSADPELGLVYVGIELPTGDWYGGSRPGAGLFGESLVALDVMTGKRRWHFQFVHHGMWDYDVPCASILADITVNGRKIKAVAQPSKQAWVYVLDRETGNPVWPIPERKVPKGDVPTEWYSPTQPFPTKPPAFDRQGVTEDELIDFTPELHAEAVKLIQDYRYGVGGPFLPPTFSQWPRPRASLVTPYGDGAGQWPGGSLDPETNMLYVFSNLSYGALANHPADPALTDQAMVSGMISEPGAERRRPTRLTVQGLPLLKPPYGRITAIDLNKGEIAWQVPHGETPDEVRNNPALKGLDIPTTGSNGKVGTLTTKTLVIAGDGTATTNEDGEKGAYLKAYDKATGAQVGRVRMAKRATGSPMTYMLDGKQYVVIATTNLGEPGELVAYRLPG